MNDVCYNLVQRIDASLKLLHCLRALLYVQKLDVIKAHKCLVGHRLSYHYFLECQLILGSLKRPHSITDLSLVGCTYFSLFLIYQTSLRLGVDETFLILANHFCILLCVYDPFHLFVLFLASLAQFLLDFLNYEVRQSNLSPLLIRHFDQGLMIFQ